MIFADVGIKLAIHESQHIPEIPVFYIHGSGGNGLVWRFQLESVGGFAIDLPGHGNSEDDDRISTVDDYARYVIEVTRDLGIKKVYFAGHSLGGAIAQKVYLLKKEIIKGLILVGTGARLRVLPEILSGLQTSFKETSEKIVNWLFSRRFENDMLRQEVLDQMLKCGSKITFRDFYACDKFDLLNDYKEGKIKIDVPVLCIVGNDDIMTPPKYSEFFRDTISAEVEIIEDAGHMIMLEKPTEVNRAILRFINKDINKSIKEGKR
jgi:pimeloyl-ACP methyl ester carboxylesterase